MNRQAFALLLLFFVLPLGLSSLAASQASAAQKWVQSGRVLVIGNDRGGLLKDRARLVEQLRRDGRKVEIRGNLCLSSCTMFLGARNVCVNPNTVFGFHGPSSYGRPLPRDQFDFWSNVMSRNFPAKLRGVFMASWRHRIDGYESVSGAQLIRQGFRSC
ncbi:hypothetical protein [Puniceibacterium sediminis]|uniref:Uncharacterized protein n=1 Tax=Puniceibacterium sediminis TaxID=1608407 RepID=A0A238YRJ2_9RHOB|nr:hypothetical protein [Puniceibacterium sediminis]SNR73757.1 hypothetical protein SAMN06265370_11970 [Puniceibacterium sediminis]